MSPGWFSKVRRSEGGKVKCPALARSKRALAEVSLDEVDFGPYQPRMRSRDADLEGLAASIARQGVIEPVIVRKKGDRVEVVAGERRVRAARMAGLKSIPAVITEVGDREAALIALVENVQRVELDPIEEAEAYRFMLSAFGMTQEELGELVGKSQPSVANKLRLLGLGDAAKGAVREGRISERHARELLKLEPGEQEAVLKLVVEMGLSVKETEEMVQRKVTERRPESSEGTEEKIGTNRGAGGGRRRGVYRDLRIFVNSLQEIVVTLRKAGVGAVLEQGEENGWFLLTVKIPKEYRSFCRNVSNMPISGKGQSVGGGAH